MSTRERIGQEISGLRKARGISLRELERMSGVGYSYISKVERGVKNVSFEAICRLLEALGATLSVIEQEKPSV